MKKKIAILFVFLATIIIGIYLYIYKDFRNTNNEKSAYFVSSTILQNDFDANDAGANEKYLDKIINVKGKITNIDSTNRTVEIDGKILAVFSDSILEKVGLDQRISLKGRFIGYDDLFQQFRLDQVVLEE